jgi:hypothetical protein
MYELDQDLIERRVGYAYNDIGFQESLTDDGEADWFIDTVAPASLGTYQYAEICEQLGQEPDYDTMDIDTDEYDRQLATYKAPQGCSLSMDYWPEGCFGIILHCESVTGVKVDRFVSASLYAEEVLR